jgi:hypothetical protein
MRYVMFAGNRLKLGEFQVHGKVYEHEEGEHEEGFLARLESLLVNIPKPQ